MIRLTNYHQHSDIAVFTRSTEQTV